MELTKEFYTRKEIMELFGISLSTVIRLEKKGELTAIHITPRKIVYDRSDLQKLIDNGKEFKHKAVGKNTNGDIEEGGR